MGPRVRRRESEDPFVIEEKEEREQEPEKVHLDDAVGIKKALDAAVIEVGRSLSGRRRTVLLVYKPASLDRCVGSY